MPSNAEGYNNNYSDAKDGFQFKIEKKVTTNHKELSNSLSFTFDKKLLNITQGFIASDENNFNTKELVPSSGHAPGFYGNELYMNNSDTTTTNTFNLSFVFPLQSSTHVIPTIPLKPTSYVFIFFFIR